MRLERPSTLRAGLALAGICAIWGFTFPAVKLALGDVGATTLVSLRFGLAAVALGLIFRRRACCLGPNSRWPVFALGFLLAAGTLLQTLGLKYTTAPRWAFITTLYVVIVPVAMALLARLRPRWTSLAAGALSLGGLYLITDPRLHGLNLGDWLTLGCAFAFAVHIVFVGIFATRYDPIALTFWQVAVASVVSLGALAAVERPHLALTPWSITAILVTGLLGTAFAFSVQTWAQRETPASHAAVIFSAEPLFATIFAYLLQGTILSPRAWLGAGLVTVGLLLTQVMPRGRRAAKEAAPASALPVGERAPAG